MKVRFGSSMSNISLLGWDKYQLYKFSRAEHSETVFYDKKWSLFIFALNIVLTLHFDFEDITFFAF